MRKEPRKKLFLRVVPVVLQDVSGDVPDAAASEEFGGSDVSEETW